MFYAKTLFYCVISFNFVVIIYLNKYIVITDNQNLLSHECS